MSEKMLFNSVRGLSGKKKERGGEGENSNVKQIYSLEKKHAQESEVGIFGPSGECTRCKL